MSLVEETRQFFDRRPCNVRHGQAAVGSLEWSRQVTERKYFVEPHIPGFAQFERWKGKKVLEIGTGIGTDTLEFARAGAKIESIDISMESLKLAWERFKHEPFVATFTCADAEKPLPFNASTWETFDLVYSFGVLHHTPHPEAVLQNVQLYLKHGGELRIMLYAKWSLKYLTRGQPEAQAGCPIAKYYSVREVRKLLEACHFSILSIKKIHIFPWRIQDYVEYRYVKRWPFRLMPAWFFAWLERHLGHHLLIVATKT